MPPTTTTDADASPSNAPLSVPTTSLHHPHQQQPQPHQANDRARGGSSMYDGSAVAGLGYEPVHRGRPLLQQQQQQLQQTGGVTSSSSSAAATAVAAAALLGGTAAGATAGGKSSSSLSATLTTTQNNNSRNLGRHASDLQQNNQQQSSETATGEEGGDSTVTATAAAGHPQRRRRNHRLPSTASSMASNHIGGALGSADDISGEGTLTLDDSDYTAGIGGGGAASRSFNDNSSGFTPSNQHRHHYQHNNVLQQQRGGSSLRLGSQRSSSIPSDSGESSNSLLYSTAPAALHSSGGVAGGGSKSAAAAIAAAAAAAEALAEGISQAHMAIRPQSPTGGGGPSNTNTTAAAFDSVSIGDRLPPKVTSSSSSVPHSAATPSALPLYPHGRVTTPAAAAASAAHVSPMHHHSHQQHHHHQPSSSTTPSGTSPSPSAANANSKEGQATSVGSSSSPAKTAKNVKWVPLCAASDLSVLAVATCNPQPLVHRGRNHHHHHASGLNALGSSFDSSDNSDDGGYGTTTNENSPLLPTDGGRVFGPTAATATKAQLANATLSYLPEGLVSDGDAASGLNADRCYGLPHGATVPYVDMAVNASGDERTASALHRDHPPCGDSGGGYHASADEKDCRHLRRAQSQQRRQQQRLLLRKAKRREEQRAEAAEEEAGRRQIAAAAASAVVGPSVVSRVYRHYFRRGASIAERLTSHEERSKSKSTTIRSDGEGEDGAEDDTTEAEGYSSTHDSSAAAGGGGTVEGNAPKQVKLKAAQKKRHFHRADESDSDSSFGFDIITIAGEELGPTTTAASSKQQQQEGDIKLARRIFLQVREDARGGVPRSSAALGPPDRYCHLFRERRRANISERVRGRVQRVRRAKQRHLETSITTIRRTTSMAAMTPSAAAAAARVASAGGQRMPTVASHSNLHQSINGFAGGGSSFVAGGAGGVVFGESPMRGGAAVSPSVPQAHHQHFAPTPTAAGFLQMQRQQSGNVFFPQSHHQQSHPFGHPFAGAAAPATPMNGSTSHTNGIGGSSFSSLQQQQQHPFATPPHHHSAPPPPQYGVYGRVPSAHYGAAAPLMATTPFSTFSISGNYYPAARVAAAGHAGSGVSTAAMAAGGLPHHHHNHEHGGIGLNSISGGGPNAADAAISSAASGVARWHAQQQLKLQISRDALERELEDLYNQRARMEGIARLYSDSPFPTPDTVWSNAAHLAKLFLESAAVHAWRHIFSHTAYDAYKQNVLARTRDEKDDRMRRVLQRNLCVLACFRADSEEKWLQDVAADVTKAAEIYKPPRSDEAERQSAQLEALQQRLEAAEAEGGEDTSALASEIAALEASLAKEETTRVESFYFTYDFVCQCFPLLKGDLSYFADYLLSQGIQRRITEVLSGGDLEAPALSDLSSDDDDENEGNAANAYGTTSGNESDGVSGESSLNLSTRSRRPSAAAADAPAAAAPEEEEEICDEEAQAIKLLQAMTSPKLSAQQQPTALPMTVGGAAAPAAVNRGGGPNSNGEEAFDDELEGFSLGGNDDTTGATCTSQQQHPTAADGSFFMQRKIDDWGHPNAEGAFDRNTSIITNAGDRFRPFDDAEEEETPQRRRALESGDDDDESRTRRAAKRRQRREAAERRAEEKRRLRRELMAVANGRAKQGDAFVKWFGLWCGIDTVGGLDSLVAAANAKTTAESAVGDGGGASSRSSASSAAPTLSSIGTGEPAFGFGGGNGAKKRRHGKGEEKDGDVSDVSKASNSSSSSSSCPESDYSNASAALDLKPRTAKALFKRKHRRAAHANANNASANASANNITTGDTAATAAKSTSLKMHRSQRILRVARAVTDMLLMPPTHGVWSNRTTTAAGTLRQLLGGGAPGGANCPTGEGSRRREQTKSGGQKKKKAAVEGRINSFMPQPQQRRAARIPFEPEPVQK